jgi:DNA processing protein
LVEALPRGYVVDTDRLAAAAGVPAETASMTLERLRRIGWVDRVDNRWRLSRGGQL